MYILRILEDNKEKKFSTVQSGLIAMRRLIEGDVDEYRASRYHLINAETGELVTEYSSDNLFKIDPDILHKDMQNVAENLLYHIRYNPLGEISVSFIDTSLKDMARMSRILEKILS